jgi:NAD(P)-dependent dehydrogenase (short-subunit alcohol dehydrogenase family)
VLNGKVGLITGGASGIGRATALCMTAKNADHVYVADLNLEGAQETCKQVKELGGSATPILCDVTDTNSVSAMVKTVVDDQGRLDFAVNNAGFEGVLTSFETYPDDVFGKVIDVDLIGVFNCMKAEILQMKSQGSGAIACTASICSFVAVKDFSAYNAAKHAVMGLVRSAAAELANAGVRINAVCPGFIETPMTTDRGLMASRGSEIYEQIAETLPNHRWGQPEEMAEAFAWLCSDAASMVNGHGLVADAGYTTV